MYNLLISLGVGLAITLGIKLAGVGSLWAGIVPGFLAFVVTYVLLARRIGAQLNVITTAFQKELAGQPPTQKEARLRIERALKILEPGLAYDKWQFFVVGEIHAQMGMLKYMTKDFEGALMHLGRAGSRNYMAKAMEGALHYQRKDYAAMRKSFDTATATGKKEALVWAVYAWCLVQLNARPEAIRVLARATAVNPTDEKLKGSLSALQNDKKLKMRPYEPMWWHFGLETPPPR